MNINIQDIKDRIQGSPCGVSAVYIVIDKKWGIKLFQCKEQRDETFKRQREAAVYGLGPDVDRIIDLPDDCDYPYGYITENVEVLVPHNEVADQIWTTYDKYSESEEFHKKVNELQNELEEKTGIYHYDIHPNNIGIKNGRYILIDFGMD